MKRKEFVKKTGAAALLMSLGVFMNSCSDDSDDMVMDDPLTNDDPSNLVSFRLNENPFDILLAEDSWLLHPKENILLVNVNGVIRAFTSVCTHSGCNDDWSYDNSQFRCNCHGSLFNNKGEVTQGPAIRNLKEFSVNIENGNVEITA